MVGGHSRRDSYSPARDPPHWSLPLSWYSVDARLGERDVSEINKLLTARNVHQPELDVRVNRGVRISTVDNFQVSVESTEGISEI